MTDQRQERRAAVRHLATFRIRLGYPDVDSFVSGYAVNISRGGIYVPTKQPREKGTEVRFEILLKDGRVAISGVGRVAWATEFDPRNPGSRYGMGVQFVSLDTASEDIVRQALEWRDQHIAAATGEREITREVPLGGADAAATETAATGVVPTPKDKADAAAPEATATAASTPADQARREATDIARKVLGDKRVSLGSVDDLLQALRGRKEAPRKPAAAPKPEEAAAEAGPTEAEPTEAKPAGVGPAEAARAEPEPEPEAAPPSAPAAPPPAPAAAASGRAAPGVPEPEARRPSAPPPEPPPEPDLDSDLPSRDDLEAGLASVIPPPPAEEEALPPPAEEEALPPPAEEEALPPPAELPAEPVGGLDLPSWDDATSEPVLPLVSPTPLAQLPESLGGEPEGRVIEAEDEDLDLDMLPEAEAEEDEALPVGELFGGSTEDDVGAAPPEAAEAAPRPPIDLEHLPASVDPGLLSAFMGEPPPSAEPAPEAPPAAPSGPPLMDLPTPEQEARISFAAPPRPSLADLPPPPDMPAPIPTPAIPTKEKKGGLFGKLFGKKRDQK